MDALQDITPSIRLAEQALQHEKQRSHDAISLARSQETFLDVVSVSARTLFRNLLRLADISILSTSYGEVLQS